MDGIHSFLNDPNNIMNLSTRQEAKLFSRYTSTQNLSDLNRNDLTQNLVNIITQGNRPKIFKRNGMVILRNQRYECRIEYCRNFTTYPRKLNNSQEILTQNIKKTSINLYRYPIRPWALVIFTNG